MSFLSGILGKIGGLFGRAMSSAPKLGSIQSGVQKLGSVANVVQKLGIGGPTVQKIAGGISKLPLEELGKTAQSAFDVGKQIFETGKKVASAFRPAVVPAEQGSVQPVAMGGAGQRVMNMEDL